jgi:hypothetical protein
VSAPAVPAVAFVSLAVRYDTGRLVHRGGLGVLGSGDGCGLASLLDVGGRAGAGAEYFRFGGGAEFGEFMF